MAIHGMQQSKHMMKEVMYLLGQFVILMIMRSLRVADNYYM